jgi:hypothetical protein
MLWNGNEREKITKLKGISRQPAPIQVMTDQQQLENVEYFGCLGSMVNGARCTWEIKPRISMAKATFRTKTLYSSKLIYLLTAIG